MPYSIVILLVRLVQRLCCSDVSVGAMEILLLSLDLLHFRTRSAGDVEVRPTVQRSFRGSKSIVPYRSTCRKRRTRISNSLMRWTVSPIDLEYVRLSSESQQCLHT